MISSLFIFLSQHNSHPKLYPGDILEFPGNNYFSHFGVYYGERDGVPYVAHLTIRGECVRVSAKPEIMKAYNASPIISLQDSDTKLLLFGRAINAAVKLDPLDVVGKRYKVRNYLDDKHPPRDFYNLIKPDIDDVMTKPITFDILFNNSEHQATMFRYGVKKSEQVRNVF